MDDQFYRKPRYGGRLAGLLKWTFKHKGMRWFLFVGVPALVFFTFSNKGLLQHIHLRKERAETQEKIRVVQEEQLRLQRLSQALDNDAAMIEKVAREKYGMIREGETVYKVKKETQ